MDLKRLFADDDAVSPVIGVILMVAITVILAAVIAALVLGLGDEPQETPQAQFEFDFGDHDGNDDNELRIAHNGGDDIPGDEIEIRGNYGSSGSAPDDLTWSGDAYDGNDPAGTGHSITVPSGDIDSDYDLTVTYVPSGGGETSPLATDSGPDA